MLAENWNIWEPSNVRLHGKYTIDTITYENQFIFIFMTSVNDPLKKIKISFKSWGLTFRKSNELVTQQKIKTLAKQYGNNFCSDWSFFISADSEYLTWTIAETCEMEFIGTIYHFAIIGTNNMFEFIHDVEPTIEFIK